MTKITKIIGPKLLPIKPPVLEVQDNQEDLAEIPTILKIDKCRCRDQALVDQVEWADKEEMCLFKSSVSV